MGLFTALAVMAVSTVASGVQQRKAAKAQRQGQERIYEQEQKRANIENVRNIRQQIRAQRLAQGTLFSQAANTGGIGGSALSGAVSSAGSQTASNVSYIQDQAQINTNIQDIQMQTANAVGKAQGNAAIYGSIGSLAGTIFSGLGGFKAVAGKLSTPSQSKKFGEADAGA